MKCPHCNSENIEVGLRMFESLNGSPVGFRFSKGLMSVVAQIHCDIHNTGDGSLRYVVGRWDIG